MTGAGRACLIWSQSGWRFAGWRAWLDGAEELRGGCGLGVGSPRLGRWVRARGRGEEHPQRVEATPGGKEVQTAVQPCDRRATPRRPFLSDRWGYGRGGDAADRGTQLQPPLRRSCLLKTCSGSCSGAHAGLPGHLLAPSLNPPPLVTPAQAPPRGPHRGHPGFRRAVRGRPGPGWR